MPTGDIMKTLFLCNDISRKALNNVFFPICLR